MAGAGFLLHVTQSTLMNDEQFAQAAELSADLIREDSWGRGRCAWENWARAVDRGEHSRGVAPTGVTLASWASDQWFPARRHPLSNRVERQAYLAVSGVLMSTRESPWHH